MKTVIALSLALVCGAALADDCYSTSQQTVPGSSAASHRVKHRVARAPAVGPALHLTPLVFSRPFAAAPAKASIKTSTRYDCAPPSSYPPGGSGWIVPGVPYRGQPMIWGTPVGFVPTGPMPVNPRSPDDFPPGATVLPSDLEQPRPTDVPEPSIIAIMAFGLFMLRKKLFRRA